MEKLKSDLAVIGAGPAGLQGAIQAAKAGKQVILIDRLGFLGGASLNQGTIPSKTLREAILDLTNFMRSSYYGQGKRPQREISIADLKNSVTKVIDDENALLSRICEKNDVEVVYGSARFADPHTIEVIGENDQVINAIEAERILIATGSRPRHPIDIPADKKIFVDSDIVFRLDHLPETMIVLGGGVIGCEYATMFAAMGIKVILMDRRDNLLRFLDVEIGQRFREYIQKLEVDVRMNQRIKELRCSEDGRAEVLMEGGESVKADCLFYSLGRIANLDTMQLDKVGLTVDKLGNLPVNSLFQTAVPHIYAAGDVIGPPGLASTSMEQGRLAVRNAFAMRAHPFPEFFPAGIYTIPEISSVGPTEEELKEQGVHYEVGRAHYYEIARGPIAGDTSGMFKVLFHAETLEVLAVHIIGTHATELVPIGQMAIHFRARVNYFVEAIFNYPTFAEGYRIAALNGLNKLTGAAARKWI